MANKKKILYLITQAEWGGAQKYVYELATSKQAGKFIIEVATGQSQNNDKTLIHKLQKAGIKTYELKHLIRPVSPIHDFLAIFELKKLIKKTKPNIIHLNSIKAGVIGSIAVKICSIFPDYRTGKHITYYVIYTIHGWAFNEPISAFKKKIYQWAERLTAKAKNLIICVSDFDRQSALNKKITPKNKLITIHNGINQNNFILLKPDQAKQALGLPNNQIIIGCIANFYETKGIKYLIEAINLLLPMVNNQLTTMVIGDGELRPRLENLISNYGLGSHFMLPGKKNKAYKYLSAFDIFVLPSIKEGFPFAIIEAMTAGLPIIASMVGGMPEAIIDQKNGLLAKPANPEDLASRIKLLIDNPDYGRQLGIQAQKDAYKNFTLEKTIKKTFKQYK